MTESCARCAPYVINKSRKTKQNGGWVTGDGERGTGDGGAREGKKTG